MHSTIAIPEGSIVMNFSSLISCARDIVLSNIKIDLRHNILEKTSVARDVAPRLHFERLKIAANCNSAKVAHKTAANPFGADSNAPNSGFD